MEWFSGFLGFLLATVIFIVVILFVTGHWIIASVVIGVAVLLGAGLFLWILGSYPG